MSLQIALARIAELQGLVPSSSVAPPAPAPTTSQAPAVSFQATLAGAGTPGQRMVALAQGELGVAEQPPGSNDAPRIAQYREATAGAPGPGPWCAYFVSWAARQAGVPIGEQGQGFGRVDDVLAWAQRTNRVVSAPQPGDLIVWDEHIGLVESVAPDGTVTTIEGNSSDQVKRNTHPAGSALAYVRLG
jgi:hypothetical protein